MTRSVPKEKLNITTRKPRPKGDMFANLRKPHEIETPPIEDLIPTDRSEATSILQHPISLVESTSLVDSSKEARLKTSLVDSTSHIKSTDQDLNVDVWGSVPEIHTGYVKLFNVIIDSIYPQLNPAEQAIYTHLFRLSWGHRKGSCFIGLPKLAARAGMSVSPAQKAITRLVSKGLIEKATLIFGRGKEQGTEFRLPLPTRLVESVRLVDSTSLVKSTYIKENTLKDTHNTEQSVGVLSRFTLQECRRYADGLRADGINNPGGYATKIHRSGEADEQITKFLAPIESAKAVDTSACPDCHGTGFYEPGGTGQGVAKCKHNKLPAAI